ncbi:stage II sporulation protein R [Clostridium sp. CAG:273]|nr:stage II sporulation protein R [Clostridia bacterium]CDE82807.1 stage II sporulation protein R [Clostridium sp. CAG:273]
MNKFISIVKSSVFKRLIIVLLLLILFIFISAISYVSAVSNNIANGVFRLHVIANSDSPEDQNLKYIVRDELIKYMNTLAKDCNSKQEVIEIAKNNISNFENIAKKTIKDNGFNYNVTVEIGNFDFPTKTYGDITLPAGTYDSLKIKIGKSEGQNWWCVMFPPLCFVDVTTGIVPEESKKEMKEAMPEEEYSLISNTNNSEVNFKFKLIEFFENIKLMAKK